MATLRTCVLCESSDVIQKRFSFVHQGNLITTQTFVCVSPPCVIARGGTVIPHKTEMGVNRQ